MFIRILSAIVLLFIMTDYSALAQANSDSLSVIVHYPCGSINLYKISSNKLSLQQFIHQIDSLCQFNDKVIANYPVFFIKTNLLYDLMTFVNASVEIPVARNWTAEATLVYPWWRNTRKHKTVQMRYVALTPRYYFKNPDKPYTSLFAGLTIGGGKYDLQWARRGVQGSMWHISPVIGYSHHISQRWKMEYSASVGFVSTKYQKYTQTRDTPYGEIKVKDYPWVSKVLNTVLPTSLNVSIVYTFTKTKHQQSHE